MQSIAHAPDPPPKGGRDCGFRRKEFGVYAVYSV